MSGTIRSLSFAPPQAIARLGSSSPVEAFRWAPGDPHTIGETRIRPDWSLEVDAEGSVTPWLPRKLRLRDGAALRHVAPFLELWAHTAESAQDQPELQPVTPQLADNGVAESDVQFTITAVNLKAARRTGDPDHRFGTFPAVAINASQHRPVPLREVSPPGSPAPSRCRPRADAAVANPAGRPAQPGRLSHLCRLSHPRRAWRSA